MTLLQGTPAGQQLQTPTATAAPTAPPSMAPGPVPTQGMQAGSSNDHLLGQVRQEFSQTQRSVEGLAQEVGQL
eukprot:8419511-Alexandrium_andersonii.AAC.1